MAVGSLAILEWVNQLARKNEFDPDIARVITVAEIIDRIYGHKETQREN